MKPTKRIALRCDLSGKEIVVGEEVVLTVGIGSFSGTITYAFQCGVVLRVGIRAGGRDYSSLSVGDDRVAYGTLFVS